MCDSQTGECLADSPELSTGTDCPTISKMIIMRTPKLILFFYSDAYKY